MNRDIYENPLISRYSSAAMSAIWSPRKKFSTWRRLWVALAESERELGIDISAEQVAELKQAINDIDFDAADRYEGELRHDVMAHVRAYADRCPNAGGILHLGATSCYVTDNADLLLIRESLELVRSRLLAVIDALSTLAEQHRNLPCLAFTHLQPAQPTTFGKRATLWCYDLVLDLEEIDHRLGQLKLRGVKGASGTQASFLRLFGGDHAKVDALERAVAQKLGLDSTYAVTGQTYSRKVDSQVLEALGGIAQSAHKAGNDLRLLQNMKEVDEPFGEKQVGSSAMAYKRNPMRCERMCSLARFGMNLAANAQQTAAVQWMERTLDDSANRRLSLPQAFLSADAVLTLYRSVVDGLVVYPNVMLRHLQDELPFMATEEILMAGVEAGGDRQELHERIRIHSQEAARQVKELGKENDLMDRLRTDASFKKVDLSATLDPARYVGRAPQQVDQFLHDVIGPIREQMRPESKRDAETVRV